MSNSFIQIPSNSKEGGIFKFYFTNGQQLDPGAHANIVDEARLRMTEDAYRTVVFCFPGSEVPHWFPFRGEGHSITINTGSLNFCSDDRLIGFTLCVVIQLEDTSYFCRYGSFGYCLKYDYYYGEHILPNTNDIKSIEGIDHSSSFFPDYGKRIILNFNEFKHLYWMTNFEQHHTLLWKYNLEFPGMSGRSRMLPHARSFTFETGPFYYNYFERPSLPTVKVKECGICPLYTKGKDDNNAGAGNYSGSVRFSNNDIEEPSGSDVAWMEEGL